MRRNISFAVLAIMLVGFIGALALRSRVAHTAPSAAPAGADSNTSVAPTSSVSPSGSAATTSSAAPSGSATTAAPKAPLLDRPLRVVGLGWEALAAGIVINDGAEPGKDSLFTKASLDVHIDARVGPKAIENALARGGKDEAGADIAILPLQRFVASYEKLKALDPVIFFVVAWSDGRDIVVSQAKAIRAMPRVKLFGEPGSSAAFLGLFALDVAGVDASKVTLVDKNEGSDFSAILHAKQASSRAKGKLLLSTAEASRLIPLVAVAQRSFVEGQTAAVTAWAETWMAGHKRVSLDASEAARRVSQAKGGPEPLAILTSLGELTPASLAENAQVAGLSGRGAVTLERLFQRTWQTWRSAELLSVPPEKAPVSPAVISALVRAGGDLSAPPAAPADKKLASTAGQPLLISSLSKRTEEAVLLEIGFLAGVFSTFADQGHRPPPDEP